MVISIIAILAALLLPALEGAKARARRIQCVSNLNQFGVAFHVFANEHGGKFPTQVSTNDGGSAEYVAAGYQAGGPFTFGYKYILPLAADLPQPNVYVCPADLQRFAALSFTRFSNSNLSYETGIVPDANDPRVILAADCGMPATPSGSLAPIVHIPFAGNPAAWSGPHAKNGNILFGDGHVELSHDAIVASEESVAEDLAYPVLQQNTSWFPTGGGGSTPQPANSAGHPNQGPVTSQPRPPVASSQASPQGSAVPPGPAVANNHPSGNRPAAPSPDIRQSMQARSSGEAVEVSNLAEDARASVGASETRDVPPPDEDFLMSPANRHAAAVMRHFLAGTYFLLLLLLLLYAAYRYWRWQQSRMEKKKQKD